MVKELRQKITNFDVERSEHRKELNKYMRVIVRGNFKGRISIGGISIQRID